MKIFKLKKTAFVFLILAFLTLIFLIPEIQNLVVSVAEKIKNKTFEDPLRWKRLIIQCALVLGVGLFLMSLYFQFIGLPKIYKNCSLLFTFDFTKTCRKYTVCILSAFLLCLGIRVFFITQKKSLHVDEVLTIAISNRNDIGYWRTTHFDSNKIYSAEELKNATLFDDISLKDVFSDVIGLHKDADDSPHTNLYYIIFRIWFACKKNLSVNFIMIYGCLLNVLFFSVSFFLVSFFLISFKLDCPKVCIGLLLGFCNPWTISTTLFLRPYELQQLSLIIFSILFIKIINKNENFESLPNFIIIALIIAFTLSTEYFNVFYVSLLGLYLITYLMLHKKTNAINFMISALICSLVLCKLFYFKWGDGLLCDRGTEALSKISTTYFLQSLRSDALQFVKVITKNNMFLSLSFIVFLLTLVMLFVKEYKNLITHLLLLACLWVLIIFYLSPYKVQRYFVPIVPVFGFIMIVLNKNIIKFSVVNFVFLLASFMTCKFNKENVVEHLDDSNIETLKILNEDDRLLIFKVKCNWKLATVLPFLNNDKNCKITYCDDEIMSIPGDKSVIYVYENDIFLDMKSDDNITVLSNLGYYNVFEVN